MTTDKEKRLAHAHEVGEQWAEFLNLKKSTTHPDRYQMTGGEKTAIGVYNTLKRLVNENGAKGLL